MDKSISVQIENKQRNGAGCLIAFGMLFGGFGLFFAWMTCIGPWVTSLQARTWVQEPCVILSSSVSESHGDDSTTYGVQVDYKYFVNDREYRGNRYDVAGVSDGNFGEKQRIVAGLPAGSESKCWVDPANPTRAVIDREFHPGWVALFVWLFPGFGAVMVYGGIKTATKPPAKLIQTPTGSTSVPALSGATAYGGAGSMMSLPSRRSAEVIELRDNMNAQMVGLIIFCVVWDSVVAIMGAAMLTSRSVCPMFLVGIFGVIGAAATFAAVKKYRQAMAPRPTIFASATTDVGGKLEMQWEFRKPPLGVRSLRLTLVGREEATYKRGTTTSTDKNVFASMPIVDTADRREIVRGRMSVPIPLDAMHSFTSANNKIVWVIEMCEAVDNTPEVKCEYAVTITPANVQELKEVPRA